MRVCGMCRAWTAEGVPHTPCWNEWLRRRTAGLCTGCGEAAATLGNWCDGCGEGNGPLHRRYPGD